MNAKMCEYVWGDSFKSGKSTKYYIVSGNQELDHEQDVMKHHGIDVEIEDLSFKYDNCVPSLPKEKYMQMNQVKIPLIDDCPVIWEKKDDSDDTASLDCKENSMAISPEAEIEQKTQESEEVARPARVINTEKREKCLDHLISIGFSMRQAKVVTRSMPADMADMIVIGIFKNESDLQKTRTRTRLRLNQIMRSENNVTKLVNLITKNAVILE